jgi:hypothetical protein
LATTPRHWNARCIADLVAVSAQRPPSSSLRTLSAFGAPPSFNRSRLFCLNLELYELKLRRPRRAS